MQNKQTTKGKRLAVGLTTMVTVAALAGLTGAPSAAAGPPTVTITPWLSSLNAPRGVAFDGAGNFYVAESGLAGSGAAGLHAHRTGEPLQPRLDHAGVADEHLVGVRDRGPDPAAGRARTRGRLRHGQRLQQEQQRLPGPGHHERVACRDRHGRPDRRAAGLRCGDRRLPQGGQCRRQGLPLHQEPRLAVPGRLPRRQPVRGAGHQGRRWHPHLRSGRRREHDRRGDEQRHHPRGLVHPERNGRAAAGLHAHLHRAGPGRHAVCRNA